MAAIGLGRQLTFWAVAFLVVVVVLWLLGDILLPFVAGMAIAYFLNPLTNRLERLGIGRTLASLAVIALFVLAFVAVILLFVPVVGGQLSAFAENVPQYIQRLQAWVANPSRAWLQRLLGDSMKSSDASIGELISQGTGWLTTFLKSLWSGGQALVSIFALVIVTPVVAFYLLNDWDRMVAKVDGWVPVQHRETVRQLAREMDGAIAGFLRGQTLVCLILGAFYAVGLTLLGLNFAILIGLVSGLITFIPYVGSMTGLVLSVGVALAQFWPEWMWILAVAAVFFAGQFVEGNILQPKLVGESAGLHPVWLMFALFAFGYLFGFVGLLLAVPLAAAVGVIARFALRRYLESPLYTGVTPQKDEASRPVPKKVR